MAFNSFNSVICLIWGFVSVCIPSCFAMWSSLVACFAIWTTWHEGNAVCRVTRRACSYEYRALVPLHSRMMFGLCSSHCLQILKLFPGKLVKRRHVHLCEGKICCWEQRSLKYLSIPDILPLITFYCCVGTSKTDLSIVSGYLSWGLQVLHSMIPLQMVFLIFRCVFRWSCLGD